MKGVLDGREGPVLDFVLMNAAASLYVAGAVGDYHEGVARAREAIAKGRARDVLESYIRLSRGASDG
jgi:anthranilate phosphoribosyltransferase